MTAEEKNDEISQKKPKHFLLLAPPMLLMSLTQGLVFTVLTDLIVYKTCLVTLKFNKTECQMLRSNFSSQEGQDLETEVEPYASMIVMINNFMEDLLPAVLCLFLGPWSDRGGRRIPLLAAMTGTALTHVTLSLMANFEISPWYFLAAGLPSNLVGSMWTIRLILICYVSDTSAGRTRMLQMALLQISMNSGGILGGLIGPLINTNYGHANVYRAAVICITLALVYTYFFITETVENASKESLRSFLKISLVKDLVRSALRQRNGFDRLVVWLMSVVIAVDAIVYRGNSTVTFLFTRARVGWGVVEFSYLDAFHIMIRISGLCLLFLRRYFSAIPDTLLAGVANLSAMGSMISISLVWKSWHMYLSSSIAIFSAFTAPVSRSVIAKFVPAEDVGKVFSLVSLLEILSSLAGPPLYTMIYSNYLPPVYPSPVYLLSCCFFVTSIICVICIDLRIRNCKKGKNYIAAPQQDSES